MPSRGPHSDASRLGLAARVGLPAARGGPATPAGAEGRRPAGDEAAAVLDLRGEVCPYTFLRSRLALEALAPGAVLRVLVDNEVSARDVPEGLRRLGHSVLAVDGPTHGVWTVVVRCASEGRAP